MPRNPRKQRCAHPGCRAWARRGYHLCVKHLDPAALPLLTPPPPESPAPASEAPSPSSDQDSLKLFVAMCQSGFPQYSIPFLAEEEFQKMQGEPFPSRDENDNPDRLLEVEAGSVIQHFFARCIEICDFAIRQLRAEVAAGRMDALYAAEQCTRLGAHLSRILAAGDAVRPSPADLAARALRRIPERMRKQWEEADPALRGPLPVFLMTPEEREKKEREDAASGAKHYGPLPWFSQPPPSLDRDPREEAILKRILEKDTLNSPGT